MALIALVNIIGPVGELIEAGSVIPDDWPDELKTSLVDTGGAQEDGDNGQPE